MFYKEEDFNLDHYHTQLGEKVERLKTLFQPYVEDSLVPLEVFPSPEKNYRMRAEFRIWHEGDEFFFVMFDKTKNEIIKLQNFPAASLIINETMAELKHLIKTEMLKRKLFQIDFLSTSTHEILISLIYHKPLKEEWVKEALELQLVLQNNLKEKFHPKTIVKILGRARNQKMILSEDFVVEEVKRNDKILRYKQVENSFTQPNYKVAEKMLSWSSEKTKNSNGDLLEMYCGNGNFSLYLADNFNRVLATEIAASSVDAAQFNIAINDIQNVDIVRLSAEEFTEAMNGVREFRRLRGIDLKSYQCETILVDPPRSGLDEKSVAMVSAFQKIVYISCNPETLANNLAALSRTHRVTAMALFDQFPFTHHVEAGVVLEKR